MNKKELREEARRRAEKFRETQTLGVYDRDEDFEYDNGWNKGEISGYEDGYYDGALSREKRIKELQQRIEQMKCCGNCSHFKLDNSGLYPINVCELIYPNRCKNHDKWKINEND